MSKKIILISAWLLASSNAMAAAITNGDFASSCNLNTWEQFGDVSVSGAPGNCAAELNIDDNNYEAELWQDVVFDDGFDYLLSVDFTFNTSQADIEDSFFISLLNQDFELYDLLLPQDLMVGANSVSLSISASDLVNNYVNQNWSLSFYLYDEIPDDGSTSNVSISSVSLDKVAGQVPEPGSLALFALGLVGFISRRLAFLPNRAFKFN
ncbi:PEP-CTERM sorting domain-containing protein [Neptunicella sp. SCSIO 80796]|uniref:PEP-CTERM sorting domain-containing protein n=1 Tax=Neptunicella plasticusilytica TaxID=3117012 RepID=UPI003A4E4DF7